jgi:hypothetical protein
MKTPDSKLGNDQFSDLRNLDEMRADPMVEKLISHRITNVRRCFFNATLQYLLGRKLGISG